MFFDTHHIQHTNCLWPSDLIWLLVQGLAKERNEWMVSMGFSKTGSLAHQRQLMQEKLALGVVRPVEQAVLQAIDLSGCLVGASKVEVADKLGSFKATFDVNGSDMLSKQVETLKVAYDWLLQMSHSSKQGILTQSLKKVEQVAKPAAALEKAADDLSSGKTMEEVVSSLGSTDLLKGAQDVTAAFMKPDKVEQEELPLSKISVHKGSLNTFINIAFSDHEAWASLGLASWEGSMEW